MNTKELFEALLTGKTVVNIDNTVSIKLEKAGLLVVKSPIEAYVGKYVEDLPNAALDLDKNSWRIKPETIHINGIEVPMPEKYELPPKVKYFLPSFNNLLDTCTICSTWYGNPVDHQRLKAGIIHLTQENAITHAKALLSFTSMKEEDV